MPCCALQPAEAHRGLAGVGLQRGAQLLSKESKSRAKSPRCSHCWPPCSHSRDEQELVPFCLRPSLPWYRHPCVMPLAGEALAPSPSRVVRPETDSSSRRGVGQVLASRTVSELRTPRGFRYTRTTSRTKSAWRPKKVDQVKPKCLETQERNRAAYARDPGPGSKRGQLDTVLHSLSLTLPPPPLPCAPCILQS